MVPRPNTWEAVSTEYTCLTRQTLAEETKMNSLLRLLPKTLFEIAATQHGINEYATLRRYVVAQCTRAKYGQHGLVSLEATVAAANELERCDARDVPEADDDDGSWPDWRPFFSYTSLSGSAIERGQKRKSQRTRLIYTA